MKPIECTAKAITPASAPGPKMATNGSQASVWMERVATRVKRPSALIPGDGETLRAHIRPLRHSRRANRLASERAVSSAAARPGTPETSRPGGWHVR